MNTIFKLCLIYKLVLIAYNSKAQNIGINGSGASAHPSALLDIDATATPSLGVLIPRISLQATNLAAPVASPATSLLVFNTATASSGTTAVTPGYYYWDGLVWQRFNTGTISGGGSGWLLTGNAGTTAGANFLGTTDNVDLVFKVNSIKAGLLSVNNTAFGYQSLTNTTTGSNNCAFGVNALNNNTTGQTNVAIGASALGSNISGQGNVAIGLGALSNNTTGTYNIGIMSGINNASGTRNISIGGGLTGLTGTDSYNMGIGASCISSTGSYNIALGVSCNQLSNGDQNIAFGTSAFQSSPGSNNVAIGLGALQANTAGGNNNVAVGANSYLLGNNSTALGAGATANVSNKVRIGGSTTTVVEGQVAYSFPSDGRFKNSVTENVKGLDFINKLRPVTYKFDTKKFNDFLLKNLPDSLKFSHSKNLDFSESQQIIHTGFIAQEVEQAAKETGFIFDAVHSPINSNDNYSVAYSQFVVPLVKSVQELSHLVDELKTQNELQQKQLELQQQEIEVLKKK